MPPDRAGNGFQNLDIEADEIVNIACDQNGTVDTGDGSDQSIHLLNWSADADTHGHDAAVFCSSRCVERQNAIRVQVVLKMLDVRMQSVSARPCGKTMNTDVKLG